MSGESEDRRNEAAGTGALAGRWLTPLFLLLAGLMLWAAWDLSRVSGWIPRTVLSVTFALLLWQSVLDLLRARRETTPPVPVGPDPRGARERRAAAWVLSLLLLTWLLGLIGGSVLFCLAWMRWHAGERWRAAAVLAAAVGLVLWGVFGRLLGTPLYPGLLPGLLA